MKRKHPLRRTLIAVAGTTSGVVLLLALKLPLSPVAGSSPVQADGAVPSAAAGPGTAGGQTVLGDATETQFGEVQVQLALDGDRITAAEAVKAPGSEARSRQISADAIPQLNAAVVQAQGAQIDAVSGASYTSKGYIQSLQSALDKARSGGSGESADGQGTGSGSDEAGESVSGAAGSAGTDAGSEAEGSDSGSAGTGEADSGSVGAGSSGSDPSDAGSSGTGSSDTGSSGPRTVLGDVANTRFGPVQVRITVNGGKLTAAEAVQTPSGDANSRSIAAKAVPELNQAAVAAQSAQIDAVSGASYTSKGYIQSLQSALDEAGV